MANTVMPCSFDSMDKVVKVRVARIGAHLVAMTAGLPGTTTSCFTDLEYDSRASR